MGLISGEGEGGVTYHLLMVKLAPRASLALPVASP